MSLDALLKARAAADRLLRFRPRSEQELRQRLRDKGYPDPVIDAVVQELTRKDLLNDQAFAQYYAANRLLLKPMGIRTLQEELRRKGIAPAVAAQALTKATAGYDELTAARALAQRRRAALAGLPSAATQRRLAGFLQRRGFSGEVVYKVIREVVTR